MLDLRPVERQHLTRAPLVLVLAQVRFTPTPSVVNGEQADALISLLRDQYPDARPEKQTVALRLPNGVQQTQDIHQLLLRDLSGAWTVTIAEDFIALAAGQYTIREEFLSRLTQVVDALASIPGAPSVVDRVGIRYVDQVTGTDVLERLGSLVRGSLLGAVSHLAPEVVLTGQMTQLNLHVERDDVILRSVVLPPNGLYDVMVNPIAEPSWVLDIDAFDVRRCAFDTKEITDTATRLSERVYSAFRWAITAEFLGEFE